ncbi:uncharacterized protein [Amphiura filiformis]|uniref:uncharacterized protein n=1 Tax=Amphiura filiformis TaxID=82378 RepID=UPI003B213ED0
MLFYGNSTLKLANKERKSGKLATLGLQFWDTAMARTKQTAKNPNYRQGKVARFGDNGSKPGTSSGTQQNSSNTKQTGSTASSSGNGDGSKSVDACESTDTVAKNVEQQTVLSVMGAFKEELICAICADKFKQPKSLSCNHTFCLQCLQNMMEQHDEDVDVECPTCRHVTDMDTHDGIIENLPTNLVAQNLVDKFERESERMVAVVKHKCSVHSSEVLCLYCETCKEAICRECALYVHCKPKHDYVNLEDFVGKLKETSLRKMHQLNDRSAEFKSNFDEFERFHKDWMLGTNQAEFWVKKVANLVLEKIEKDKREKLALINDKQEFQNMLFKNYGDYFGTLLKKIKEVIYSKTDLDKIPDVEYLGIHENLIENVDHLLKQDLPSFDHEAWNYSVMFQSNNELINENLSLGSVEINRDEGLMLKFGGAKHGMKRSRETVDKDGGTAEGVGKKQAVGTYCDCKGHSVAATAQDGRVTSHSSMKTGNPSVSVSADGKNTCSALKAQQGSCCRHTPKLSKAVEVKPSSATKETGKGAISGNASKEKGTASHVAAGSHPQDSVSVSLPAVKQTIEGQGHECKEKYTKEPKCRAGNLTEEIISVPSPSAEIVVESQVDACQDTTSKHVHCDHCYSTRT